VSARPAAERVGRRPGSRHIRGGGSRSDEVGQNPRISHSLTFPLEPAPEAATEARRIVGSLEMPLERRDVVQLLVSELVTNSIRHSRWDRGRRFELRVRPPDHCVRIEVCDAGGEWTQQATSRSLTAEETPGGWGLLLVDRLADRWGIVREEGTCVWFEVDC
jgi:anti-sigma regulatory factor (Ser/Thr protein kinase)